MSVRKNSMRKHSIGNLSLPGSKHKGEEPLFEEEWSKIYPDELVIPWYYFPTAGSKRILTKDIKGIYYHTQDHRSTIAQVKAWGQSFTPCWWACDSKRGFRKNSDVEGFYNVVIDVGDGTMKGFTTANLDAFLEILTPQCSPDVICQEGFPWGDQQS